MSKPNCPDCGGTNVEIDMTHPEGDRLFCFDCAPDVERETVVQMEPLSRTPVKVVPDYDRCPGCLRRPCSSKG
jgi:hypothetical protein